jgi:hypothetical protein
MSAENARPAYQQPNWPTGLADVLNSRKWVYSYWVNAIDHWYYSGDAAAFNAFVASFAKLGTEPRKVDLPDGQKITIQQDLPPLMLVLRKGHPRTGRFDISSEATIPYDWHVEINGWSSALVGNQAAPVLELWTGGSVKLSKVSIPPNVEVRAEYPATAEMKKLVADHEAKRAKEK